MVGEKGRLGRVSAIVIMKFTYLIFYAFLSLACAVLAEEAGSAGQLVEVEVVAEGLEHPWGMAFLPNKDILVTERAGRLRLIRDGKLLEEPITGLPAIREKGQGGLLGIALHPAFHENGWVYLAYVKEGEDGFGTEVLRGKLQGRALTETEVIFRALPKSGGGRHFGARLVFAADGRLFVGLGDRGKRDTAQDLSDHRGVLIRIEDDGGIPADNPFIKRSASVRPEIYTYGNRNIQGMALHAETGLLWTHEHGPQGGDELNIMRPGRNYGWPVITYGVNYGFGTQIGEGTHKQGMEQPLHVWVPSIAPSGMAFYSADKFPQWQGDLFVGSLKFGQLVRLQLQGEKVVNEERLLNNRYGRIRDVVQGPDGYLYVLTDEENGMLLKISPVTAAQHE